MTGVDTDRLKEEKERGITIDLGFAPLDLPSGERVGIVDVPGHERFVKNMVAGATGIDLVILVIAADEGVMLQTREHLDICQLLGTRGGVVALTKTDLVDDEWLEMVTEDVREYLTGTFLDRAPVIPFSSQDGSGGKELLAAIDEAVKSVSFRSPVRCRYISPSGGPCLYHEGIRDRYHRHLDIGHDIRRRGSAVLP